MKPRILLVNPPVYDFTAYDFWLKPYGLLRVAGRFRNRAEFRLFDFLDRLHPAMETPRKKRPDPFGRGPYREETIPRPAPLAAIPRRFRRFGLPRAVFREFLRKEGPFRAALVSTGMTYWVPGVRETLQDLQDLAPGAPVVLGGVYASLCPDHARTLGPDLVIQGDALKPLEEIVGLAPAGEDVPLWEAYPRLRTGVLRLADGCPFRCTYCAVRLLAPAHVPRPRDLVFQELDLLRKRGAEDVAFYDDALLAGPRDERLDFLERLASTPQTPRFHTPNALHARLLDEERARALVRAGFRTFYLGFESASERWQEGSGGKVSAPDLRRAAENLLRAGADANRVTAYLLIGHPRHEAQDLEDSLRFASSLGIRVMLSEFSPVPGTPDFEAARPWADLDEPLLHNKTAFPVFRLGGDEVNRFKDLARRLNERR